MKQKNQINKCLKNGKRKKNKKKLKEKFSHAKVVTTSGKDIRKQSLKAKTKSAKAAIRPNKKRFGSVSSDSDPELIEENNWGFPEDDASVDDQFNNGENDTIPKKNQFISDEVVMSSDLEDSETDLDEEPIDTGSTHSNDSSNSESLQGSDKESPASSDVVASLKNTKTSDPCQPPSPNPSSHSAKESHITFDLVSGWNTEQHVLTEIERRAVDLSMRSLYVFPVPTDCSLEKLKRLSPTAVSARLACHPHTRLCRRYAFLEYADSHAASVARKQIMGRLFAGHAVSVQPVRPQFTLDQGATCVDRRQLQISGIHSSVTKADLGQLFAKASEIDYPRHAAGHPFGYAIAKFVNDDVAFETFRSTHKRTLKGQTLYVNYVISPRRPADVNSRGNDPRRPIQLIHSNKAPANVSDSVAVVSSSSLAQACNLKPVSTRVSQPVTSCSSKVIIQPISEADMKLDDDFGVRTEPESQPFLQPFKNSNILSSLVQSRRKEKPTSSDDQVSDTGSDDDDDATSDSEARASTESSSDAEDSGGMGENEIATGSSDDHLDGELDEEVEETADANHESSDSSSSFEFSATNNHQTMECVEDSSGEEIDRTLNAVMRARRGAARALKNAGSSKRNRSAASSAKPFGFKRPGSQVQGKFSKLMLPVPSKRKKLMP